jgi:hypothetical protein
MTGDQILDEVERALERYVIFPGEPERIACTLWTVATHFQPALDYAPRLTVKSPHKRCGKSRLLDVMADLVHRQIITVNISVAALVRTIDEMDPPTLLVDEADKLFTRSKSGDGREDLIGIINSGYQRGRPYQRWDVTTRSMESLPSFCMVVTAGIGDRPDTIEDRGPIIELRRRSHSDRRPDPYRIRRDRPGLIGLQDKLHEWAIPNMPRLAEILESLSQDPASMPVEDRDADKWEGLIAVADLAGGHWPERARAACNVMCAVVGDGEDIGGELLRDLYRLFNPPASDNGTRPAPYDQLPTSWLVTALRNTEESPWETYERRGLTSNDLARLLKPYGVRSTTIRFTDGVRKGYYRLDPRDGKDGMKSLHDAWTRYCRECR